MDFSCDLLTFQKLIIIDKFMKYNQLVDSIQRPVFTRHELLLQGFSFYDYQLSLWVKKGHLLRLRKGVYAFAREVDKVEGEEIAQVLYSPSYLSLESALSWYGFIPEMSYAYVSVTSRINRVFDNYFGRFIYRHIKRELFWGYIAVSARHGHYLLAEPEKALLDYLYLNLSRIKSQADLDSFRFNYDQIDERIDKYKFQKYLQAFGIKKMQELAEKCLH